jgi:LysM repeat protein
LIVNFILHALLLLQLVGGEFTYTVRGGDSLTSIGAYYGVEARVIAETNGLNASARLQPDQILQIDNRHIVPRPQGTDLLVNIPQRMLFLYEGSSVRGYPIAAGKRT